MGTRRTWLALALSLASLALFACDSEQLYVGVDEPIVVRNAQLNKGKLPGKPSADTSDEAEGPIVTSLDLRFGVINPGSTSLRVSGRTTGDAYAVAIRIIDAGTGYWLQPVGAEDPTNPGELEYLFQFDANSEFEPGQHTLGVVAFDKNGNPGPQFRIGVCVASRLPDNLNACNPEIAPPAAIVSLSWNADADLDLTLIAPDGKRYDRGNRLLFKGSEQVGGLDADGVTGCLLDGRRYENFVFNELPPEGTWLAYASLFDACGKAAVSFDLTVHRARDNGDGTFSLVEEQRVDGQLIRAQASGGQGTPLYLAPVSF